MTMLEIILVIVALIEIFGFIIALIMLQNQIAQLKNQQAYFQEHVLSATKTFADVTREQIDKQTEIVVSLTSMYKNILESYEFFRNQYNGMLEQYRYITDGFTTMGDHYHKLLDAWKNVEERYSDCYDQLDQMNKKLDGFEQQYWKPDILNLDFKFDPDIYKTKDCKYNYCGECQNEDCPALNMYCTAEDPQSCEYSDKYVMEN